MRSDEQPPCGPREIPALNIKWKSSLMLQVPFGVNHKIKTAVLDTGSQLNLISPDVATDFGAVFENLEPVVNLQMANGSITEAKFGVKVMAKIGRKNYPMDLVVVPNLPFSVVLGLDFILRKDVRIIPGEEEMWIEGDRFPLPDCRKGPRNMGLAVAEKVVIPARSEMAIGLNGKGSENGTVLCEGTKAASALGLLVATTVSKTSGGKVLARIANPTTKAIEIPASVIIAQCEVVVERKTAQETAPKTMVAMTAVEMEKRLGQAKRLFKDTDLDMGANLTTDQKEMMLKLLDDYEEIMSKHESDTGLTDLVEHQIETGNAAPCHQAPYRISFAERAQVQSMVNEYIDAGFVRESDSPWACPIVLVRKKDGTLRFCCDWRRLNAVTRKDAMPLPRIDDMIDRLAKAKYFTKLDFTSGYYQVKLAEEAREKTAFVTPDGHYEWLVMGMGLTNAPATFQRLMYKVLGGLLWTNSMAYLDDIVVFSATFEQHVADLSEVFDRIAKAKLKIKPPKCSFGKSGISYLGFIISPKGVECDPANTEKVANFREPTSRKEVRSFLGLTSYYRKFIRNYAFIAKPLYELTKNETEFEWKEAQQLAFEALRSALVSPPILAFPDFEKPFMVTTDASGYGIGCVLKQVEEGKGEKVIAYASRILSEVEQRYSVTERECLALKYATQVFRPYLHGTKFKVITDHKSLVHLKTMRNGNGRMQRFNMHLMDFDFEIEFKEGKRNADADTLSRYGYPTSGMDEDSDNEVDSGVGKDSDKEARKRKRSEGQEPPEMERTVNDTIRRTGQKQRRLERPELEGEAENQRMSEKLSEMNCESASEESDISNNSERCHEELRQKSLRIMTAEREGTQQDKTTVTAPWDSNAVEINRRNSDSITPTEKSITNNDQCGYPTSIVSDSVRQTVAVTDISASTCANNAMSGASTAAAKTTNDEITRNR